MKIQAFLIVFALFFAFIGCKQTTESEGNAWKNNVESVKSLAIDYPNYKPFLEAQIKAAQKVMEAAKGISDEEKKIEKMSDANELINKGIVGELKKIKATTSDLKTTINSATGTKFGESESTAKRILQEANDAILESQKILKANVASKEDGIRMARKANQLLTDKENEVSEFMTKFESANSKKIDVKTDEKTDVKKDEPKMVKCEYCKVKNDAKNAKCSACGAPMK